MILHIDAHTSAKGHASTREKEQLILIHKAILAFLSWPFFCMLHGAIPISPGVAGDDLCNTERASAGLSSMPLLCSGSMIEGRLTFRSS